MTSATRLAAEIRRGERSAVDAVGAAIVAATRDQERFNACTLVDADRALARAEEIDRRVAAGQDPGPLAGVPVALKDLIDHAGRVTTCGSAFYRETADRSATVVERLENAGAVIVARTGLHEFAYGFSSENQWFGPVRNPFDPSLSPGGSSGGSAVAVAAGHVPVAIGTDTGGSIRVPAALCGVFGLKVTHGRVPLTGVFPLAPSLDTVGPLALRVEDLTLVYRVIAGHDPVDPWSAPRPVIAPQGPRPDLRNLRLGLPVRWVDTAPVTQDVAEAFTRATAALESLGARIEELHDDLLVPPGPTLELVGAEAAAVHRRWLAEGKPYGDEVRRRLERAVEVTVDQYVAASARRAELRHRVEAAFGRFDLLIMPATGATRKPIGVETIPTLDGERHYREVLSWFTSLVNVLGCPALAGPLPSASRPPPSLQLVAPRWQEHRLLEVAATLVEAGIFAQEQASEGWKSESRDDSGTGLH